MKQIANIISMCRMILSFVLFFSINNTLLFLILYIICGVSDVLDGYIARKTNTQSELGARLDSIADLILCAVIMVSVTLWLGKDILIFLPWIIIIFLIRCINIAIVGFKYHSFAILHTWGNKITGLLLFIIPLFIIFQQFAVLWLVCIVAILSAVEESIIHITSAKLNVNRQSFFKPDRL